MMSKGLRISKVYSEKKKLIVYSHLSTTRLITLMKNSQQNKTLNILLIPIVMKFLRSNCSDI
jgi:hypothetical protein